MATPDPAALTTGFKQLDSIGAIGTGPGNVRKLFGYNTNDTKAQVETAGYFNTIISAYDGLVAVGDALIVSGDSDGTPFISIYVFDTVTADVTITEGSIGIGASAQELTATGTVTPGVRAVELNHATVIVAATIADAANHQGLFVVKNTSASGTAAHTLTLTSGTFDGTNDVATLNAPNECLVVFFDSAGNGTIVENVGSVGLS